MPRAKSVCLEAGCPKVTVHSGRCIDHHEPRKPWQRTSARNLSRPSDWRTRRKQCLMRDRWTCYLCGAPGADEADHLVPVSRGGSHELDNLRAVHKGCHRLKTMRERNGH
ncbi:HNH endonuclease [Streptomyces sp. 769]|nr:HNH endonuclease [Streptomyces sp. 769]